MEQYHRNQDAALDCTVKALNSIVLHQELSMKYGISPYPNELQFARDEIEDVLYYLTVEKTGDHAGNIREILERYGLQYMK